jgi:chromosome segregation ATPase
MMKMWDQMRSFLARLLRRAAETIDGRSSPESGPQHLGDRLDEAVQRRARQTDQLERVETQLEAIQTGMGTLRESLGTMHERITQARERQQQIEANQQNLEEGTRQLAATLVQKEETLEKIDTLVEIEERRLGLRQLLATPATSAMIGAFTATLLMWIL